MRIAHIFHSIDDLETRISHGFRLKLEQLLCAYKLKKKTVTTPSMLRAMCVAFAFVEMAMDGEQARAAQFDNMLHGLAPEHIEWENSYLRYDDDTLNEELLMWDIACLLLDEHADAAPQFAFDIAERHVYMAYRLSQPPVPAEAPKQTATAVIAKRPALAAAQRPAAMPIDITTTKGEWEAYAKCSQEELILGHMIKDVQLKESKNTISLLTRLLSLRNTNNFYQGDIRTQINGGDIDMKPQKE